MTSSRQVEILEVHGRICSPTTTANSPVKLSANGNPQQIPENSNTQIPPAPNPTPAQPESKKKFLIIAIVIIALLLIAGSVFAAYQYGRKQQIQQNENKPTSSALPTNTAPKVVDKTANWKTYTNTQYGFSLSIPKQMQISTSSGVISFYQGEETECCGSTGPNLNISINNPVGLDKSPSDTESTMIVAGENLTKLTGLSGTRIGPLVHNKQSLVFEIYEKDMADKDFDQIYQILSTFKFLQNPNTTNDFSSDYFIWNVSDSKLPDTTLQQIKTAFMNFIPPGAGEGVLKRRKIEITGFDTSSTSANMVFASTMLVDQNKQPVPVDPAEYMLVNKDNTWNIFPASSTEFCLNLRNAPEDLLSGFRRVYYGNCF